MHARALLHCRAAVRATRLRLVVGDSFDPGGVTFCGKQTLSRNTFCVDVDVAAGRETPRWMR